MYSVEHDTKPEPEPAQSEASHPRPGDSPDLITWGRLGSSPGPRPALLHGGLSGQDVSDLSLLQDQRQLVVVEKVDHGVLREQPHGQQSQAGVLTGEPGTQPSTSLQPPADHCSPVVVGVECSVVEIEESQPVSLGDVGVAADGVVLVADPDYQDHVEGRGCVLEKLGHDRLHPDQGQDDGEEGGGREGDVGVELQHLEEIHDEDKYLVLGIPQ